MSLLMLFAFIEAFAPPRHHFTQYRRQPFAATPKSGGTIMGPPIDTKPDYSSIHGRLGPLVDSFLMSYFEENLPRNSTDQATVSRYKTPTVHMMI